MARGATEALLSAGFKLVARLSGWDIVSSLKKTEKPLSKLKPIKLDNSPFAMQPVQIPLCATINLVNEEATTSLEIGGKQSKIIWLSFFNSRMF